MSSDQRSEDPRSEDPRSEDPRSEDPRSEDPRSEDPRSEETPPTEQAAHDQALARVKQRRDLGAHAFVYLVVNVAVWAVWAVTGHGYPWPAWVSGGWAVGLVLNAWDVYGRRPITEADVRREMDRLRPQH